MASQMMALILSTLCILLSIVAHSGSLAAGVSLDRQTPVENKSTVQEGLPFTVTYLVKFGTQSLPETIQFNWSNGFSVDMSSGPINISSVRGEKHYSISDCDIRFNINTASNGTQTLSLTMSVNKVKRNDSGSYTCRVHCSRISDTVTLKVQNVSNNVYPSISRSQCNDNWITSEALTTEPSMTSLDSNTSTNGSMSALIILVVAVTMGTVAPIALITVCIVSSKWKRTRKTLQITGNIHNASSAGLNAGVPGSDRNVITLKATHDNEDQVYADVRETEHPAYTVSMVAVGAGGNSHTSGRQQEDVKPSREMRTAARHQIRSEYLCLQNRTIWWYQT